MRFNISADNVLFKEDFENPGSFMKVFPWNMAGARVTQSRLICEAFRMDNDQDTIPKIRTGQTRSDAFHAARGQDFSRLIHFALVQLLDLDAVVVAEHLR